jgi:predicted dithiol-disulfide oxidoreductase (DUF899 family)
MSMEEIARLEEEVASLKEELAAARRGQEPEPVGNYTLHTKEGNPVTLRELFGDRADLIVVHNMGQSCPYCTLWADGFIGLTPHLEDRAAFVLCSPDEPATLKTFSESRGWPFRVVSGHGTTFARDLGFEPEPGRYGPGVSALHRRDDGSIVRTGRSSFGPGDDFCAVWPLFEMLADGPNGWQPKYWYDRPAGGGCGCSCDCG